jgi:hypothetical protein
MKATEKRKLYKAMVREQARNGKLPDGRGGWTTKAGNDGVTQMYIAGYKFDRRK